MAQIQMTSIPEDITAADANDNELICDNLDREFIEGRICHATVEVISGGPIKFRAGGNPVAGSSSLALNQKAVIPIIPGYKNLFFKATAGGDKFRISF